MKPDNITQAFPDTAGAASPDNSRHWTYRDQIRELPEFKEVLKDKGLEANIPCPECKGIACLARSSSGVYIFDMGHQYTIYLFCVACGLRFNFMETVEIAARQVYLS